MNNSDEGRIPIFISSVHFGLQDLRGELAQFLTEFGAWPRLSSESGFPDYSGMQPYAQCLVELEKSLIVLGVIDRRYGTKFEEWGPYEQYSGCSPTHAEFRHALELNKRFLVFVRKEVHDYYDVYRVNKDNPTLQLPKGVDRDVMVMYEEIKRAQPAPWIETFSDVRDIKKSVQSRLLNDLRAALSEREAYIRSDSEQLLQSLIESDPKIREALLERAQVEGQETIEEMKTILEQLESKPKQTPGTILEKMKTVQTTLTSDNLRKVIEMTSDILGLY